jgi:hypothetical protein
MKKNKAIILALMTFMVIVFSMNGFSQVSSLKAGIAKTDITPSERLFMGGYDSSCRSEPSDGTDSKIYVRALVFDDNTSKVAFVEIDIVSYPNEEYAAIRKLISSETGIAFDNIMLGCVHNHAAPYPDSQNKDSKWSAQLKGNIVLTVKNAIKDLEPVKIGGGKGVSTVAMNRRKKLEDITSVITFDENNSSQSYGKYKTDKPVMIREMEGVCRLGANPSGPIDNEVGVLRIDKMSGEPKAVFVNYACHGTSLGGRNNKISGEWNGHMLEYIEKNVPGIISIFAQGAAGDINPRYIGGLDGNKDDLQKTAELGYEIGKEVVRVLSGIKTEIPVNPQIRLSKENITCPRRYGEVMRDFRNTTIDVPTTAVKIDNFTWVMYPLELFHEIGKTIKVNTHSPFPFIVGYCNGSMGYLPTQQSHSEGGYEPNATHFDPVTEKIFLKGVEKLLAGLY